MGEQLGLSDQFAPEAAGTLMSAFLVNGERVLPSVSDVAEANTGTVVQGWHDQLMHNGDNFNFPPSTTTTTTTTTTTAVPLVGGAPAPVASPGVTGLAGDVFHWVADTVASNAPALGSVFNMIDGSKAVPHAIIDSA